MSEQPKNKHEVIRQMEQHANTTLIWRKQGEPIGSSVSAGDQRFIRRALVGSAVALILLILLGVLAARNFGSLRRAYAELLMERGDYKKAQTQILSLDDLDVRTELLKKNAYVCATAYEKEGRLSDAVPLYQAAGDYPGALEALRRAGYTLAQMYEADGDYLEASETYNALGDYLDAAQKSEATSYAYAKERLEYGYYDEAMRLFYSLGSYENAEGYAKEAAAALSENDGAGELVSLLVGLTDEQLAQRAALKAQRDALPQGMIATGYKHTVARKEDGTVLATGSNLSGQCNTAEWADIVSVAAGAYHTVGLRADGTVVATGMNTYGQCNVGNWTNVKAVYAGAYNTAAITKDGKILNTGYQTWNTLKWHEVARLSIGDYALCGVMDNGQPLVTHSGLTTDNYYDLVAFDAATANSAGLKADGTVVSNGLDVSTLSGILAIDCTSNGLFALDTEGTVTTRAFSYAHLPDVSDWSHIVAISASATHVAGVTSDGRVLSRGASDMGQCNTQEWVLFTPAPTPTPEPSGDPQATPNP
ncbi:MAG: hypothetical protein VB062_07985 [Christensenella sp.]|nr:hypothetical protein [Christensenella sp.]